MRTIYSVNKASKGSGNKIQHMFIVVLVIATIICNPSCGETFTFKVDCEKCVSIKPKEAPITITVSINDENKRIPVTIYYGDINSNYFERDTISTEHFSKSMPLENNYSIKAEYNKNGKKYFVVDGGKFETKEINDYCGDLCYLIDGGNYKVTLP